MILGTVYRYLAILGVVLAALIGSYFYGRESVPEVVRTVEVEKVVQVVTEGKVVEKIVYRDRETEKKTTTIRRADGTVITTEDEKTKDVDKVDDKDTTSKQVVQSKEVDKTHEVLTSTGSTERSYMVGVSKGVRIDLNVKPSLQDGQEVTVGRRLVGGLWITGGFSTVGNKPGDKGSALIGVAYSW